MRADTFTNTPEDAAAYEAVRGAAEWIGSEPSPAELDDDEPQPDPWGDPPTTPRERLTFTTEPPF